GENFMFSIFTTWSGGAAFAAIAREMPAAATAASSIVHTATPTRARNSLRSAETALKMPGMVQVFDERRANLDEERLQFGVLRVGDEHGVDRLNHLLMISDLVINVGLVESLAFESAEIGKIFFPAGFQSAAGVIFLGRHLEFRHEFHRA